MLNFTFCEGRKQAVTNSLSSWTWIWLIQIQLQKSSLAFDKVSELETEKMWIHFSMRRFRDRQPSRYLATEMIPTIEMISATEMTHNQHRNDPHHRNDTYSQSKCSRHKFLEPWLKWTWDFAIYSKFFVYSCKQDSKQRKIEKAIRLITILYTDFIFKILTFF